MLNENVVYNIPIAISNIATQLAKDFKVEAGFESGKSYHYYTEEDELVLDLCYDLMQIVRGTKYKPILDQYRAIFLGKLTKEKAAKEAACISLQRVRETKVKNKHNKHNTKTGMLSISDNSSSFGFGGHYGC